MTLDIRADTRSCTLRIAADETWESAETVAAENGLTLDYLVDTRPGRTVGETLAAPSWLPPLWPPHTVRAACIALSGIDPSGAPYASVVAPRTASGPDLRSLFLEASGAFGGITAATLRCEPASATLWLRPRAGAVPLELQSVVNRFGSVVTVHGDESGAVVRVRQGTRLAALAVEALDTIGFVPATRPARRWRPRIVATVPWDSLSDAMRPRGASEPELLACGPTHVAVGVAVSDPASIAVATAWAQAQVSAGRSIGRVVHDVGGRPPATAPVFGQVAR